jgi:ankyrin repeat protein
MANVNMIKNFTNDKDEFLRYLASVSQDTLDELSFKAIKDSSYSEFLKLLISKKFVTNPLNHKGQTLLHYAVVCNNLDAINILLDLGFNTNEIDDEGRTPLHLAVAKDVSILLTYENCDASFPNDIGQEPINIAYKHNNKEIIKLLYDFTQKNKSTI